MVGGLPSDPLISTYISKRSGRVSTVSPAAVGLAEAIADAQEFGEPVLQLQRFPSIHTCRNLETGEITSLCTTIERTAGGYISTKRRRTMPTEQMEGRSGLTESHLHYDSTQRSFIHKFKVSEAGMPEISRQVSTAAQIAAPSQLQDVGLEDMNEGIDPSPAIAHVRERISRRRNQRPRQAVTPRLSDEEKLRETLDLYKFRVHTLSGSQVDNPHLRVSAVNRHGRTFAVASAYMKSNAGRRAVITVFWQFRESPHKAVAITFSLPAQDEAGTEADATEHLTASCTCCHLVPQKIGTTGGCYHAQTCLENKEFVEMVAREIRKRQRARQLEGDSVFGRCIELERLGEYWHYLTVYLEATKNLCMFFMVFDVNMQMFVPVSMPYRKPFQCMLCRGGSNRRGTCDHEETVGRACKKLRRTGQATGMIEKLLAQVPNQGSDSDTNLEDDEDSQSDADDDDDMNSNEEDGIQPNRSVRVPNEYIPLDVKRPILPCPGERKKMERLALKLDALLKGEMLELDEVGRVSCPKCHTLNNKTRQFGYRRELTLFTLTQGSPTIAVYDWWCETCREMRYFSGRPWGIFPARRKSAYTTELLYLMHEMSCLHGLSFRTSYKVIRLFTRTPSIVRRLVTSSVDTMTNEHKRSRRRANDAFNSFLKHLDTSSPAMTNELFSCQECEVPLTKQDCEELGIAEDKGRYMKRLKAVVIDGTAAGVLTALPTYHRDLVQVPPAGHGLGAVTLMKTPAQRKLLIKLLDTARDSLRSWKAKRTLLPAIGSSIDASYLRFWLRNDAKLKLDGIETPRMHMTESESQITQLYLSEDACFCPPDSYERAMTNTHTEDCEEVRQTFISANECPEVSAALRQLFSVTRSNDGQHAIHPSGPPGSTVPEPGALLSSPELGGDAIEMPVFLPGDEEGESDIDNSNDEIDDTNVDGLLNEAQRARRHCIPGLWATLMIPNAKLFAQFGEAVISLVRFLLVEHIGMPYVGRVCANPLNNPNESSVPDTGYSHGGDGRDTPTTNNNPGSTPVEGNAIANNIASTGTNPGTETNTNSYSNEADTRDTGRTRPDSMISFISTPLALHKELYESLDGYLSCMHFQVQGRVQTVPSECECTKKFKLATVAINELNPALGVFCQELLKLKRPLHINNSSIITSVMDLLKRHMESAKAYFRTLEDRLSEESKDYWREYGMAEDSLIHQGRGMFARTGSAQQSTGQMESAEINTDAQNISSTRRPALRPPLYNRNLEGNVEHETENIAEQNNPAGSGQEEGGINEQNIEDLLKRLEEEELESACTSGLCFPGRSACRPCILFNTKDKPSCSKKYKVSHTHTPGLLTILCACETPKLIGFVIMTQAESTALALSAILSHFGIPPRCVYYDNACNLFVSTIIRAPWLLSKTRFAVDRFHYKSHKCCSYFNPDSYRQLDMQRTEAAESINARIKRGINTIRYMKGERLIWYLRALFSLLNLVARFQQEYNRRDMEDEDLTKFFQTLVKCKCQNCADIPSDEAEEELETKKIIDEDDSE